MDRFIRVVLTFAVVASSIAAFGAETTKESLDTVKTNVSEGRAVLVDVRDKDEWDAGHIADAIFLPLTELQAGLDAGQLAKRLPKDKILYTYCVAGRRSLAAANILERHGYQVRSLKPGYRELLAAGFKKANP